ncbi:unnamed protein product [Calypogeia fissa]
MAAIKLLTFLCFLIANILFVRSQDSFEKCTSVDYDALMGKLPFATNFTLVPAGFYAETASGACYVLDVHQSGFAKKHRSIFYAYHCAVTFGYGTTAVNTARNTAEFCHCVQAMFNLPFMIPLKSGLQWIFARDCHLNSRKVNDLALYRPGTGTIWILKNENGVFSPRYAEGDPGTGIGGYNLLSWADRVFAYDYDHSGKVDHIALYRPGTGTIWILKNSNGTFLPVYAQGDPGSGIGGYDLRSAADRAFAYDYDHSGKLDHLALYRPGTGTIWILKNENGVFSPVYAQGDPGYGIGGYDLRSRADRIITYDYDHSGKMDHIVLYRPGTGTIWILKNCYGIFIPVYRQGDPGNGIGGYDLRSPADRIFAYDYDSSGKMDHLALYRPGTGTIWILKNSNGNFSPVYAQGDPGTGIGGYDLLSRADTAFAYDYDGSGKKDHIALYRPGTGTIWILKNDNGVFSRVYAQGDPGSGIGGYDLLSPADSAFTVM